VGNKGKKEEYLSDSPSDAVGGRCTAAPANNTGKAEESFTKRGKLRHFTQYCLPSANY